MLITVYSALPELVPCHLAYAEATVLKFGNYSMLSQMAPKARQLSPFLLTISTNFVENVIRSDITRLPR